MLAKFFTYVFLWGPILSLFKVIGRKRFLAFPLPLFRILKPTCGIIGCGQFSFSNILPRLYLRYGAIFRSSYDPDEVAQASFNRMFNVGLMSTHRSQIFSDDCIDLVYIASPHSTHSAYAIEALHAGKNVYIEKPISVSFDQLSSLYCAYKASSRSIYTGFNRPHSSFIKNIKRHYLKSPSPFFCSMTIFGHSIPRDHWYREPSQGSRVAGNLSHWIDLAIHMLSWHDLVWPLSLSIIKSDSKYHDENFVLHIKSSTGSMITISFFAKNEPHLGVTEIISFQSSSFTALIDNFQTMRIDFTNFVSTKRNLFKDAGHTAALRFPFSSHSIVSSLRANESFISSELTIHLSDLVNCGNCNSLFKPSIHC